MQYVALIWIAWLAPTPIEPGLSGIPARVTLNAFMK